MQTIVWLVITGLLVGVCEAAFRLGRRWTLVQCEVGDDGVGWVLSAASALLGLLIAFTFSMAVERYDARRLLVVDEANAVSTTFLRHQLLAEPERVGLTRLMGEYVEARRRYYTLGEAHDEIEAAMTRTEAVQARLWTATRQALATPAGAQIAVPLLDATNTMFDLAASRHATRQAHIPSRVLVILLVYAVATAAILGVSFATVGRRRLIATTGLFLLVGLAISLILDLDAPRLGGVREPHEAFLRVADQVRAAAAALP